MFKPICHVQKPRTLLSTWQRSDLTRSQAYLVWNVDTLPLRICTFASISKQEAGWHKPLNPDGNIRATAASEIHLIESSSGRSDQLRARTCAPCWTTRTFHEQSTIAALPPGVSQCSSSKGQGNDSGDDPGRQDSETGGLPVQQRYNAIPKLRTSTASVYKPLVSPRVGQ